jgi:hypothetical protein
MPSLLVVRHGDHRCVAACVLVRVRLRQQNPASTSLLPLSFFRSLLSLRSFGPFALPGNRAPAWLPSRRPINRGRERLLVPASALVKPGSVKAATCSAAVRLCRRFGSPLA